MTSFPLVSVIIPAFNPGAYLKEALDSLRQQSYKPIELILVDDGSTPPCTDYNIDLSDLTYTYQVNAGPAAARNTGVNLSNGSLIAFHDADDLCDPQKIEKQVSMLRATPALGFVLTKIKNFLEPGIHSPDWFKGEESLENRMGFVTTALIRRECLDLVGPFDTQYRIGEDIDWLIRARDAGIEHSMLPEVLFHRRVHDANSSANITLGHENLAKILSTSIRRRKKSSGN